MTEPVSPPGPRQTMAQRYGRPARTSTIVGVVVVAALAVALSALLGWAAWDRSQPDVGGQVHSFDVVSEHRVQVTLDIYRPGTQAVTCSVSAQAGDHTVVGEGEVRLPAGTSGDHRVTATVRTDRAAVTVILGTCH